jgi:hypothetical protein
VEGKNNFDTSHFFAPKYQVLSLHFKFEQKYPSTRSIRSFGLPSNPLKIIIIFNLLLKFFIRAFWSVVCRDAKLTGNWMEKINGPIFFVVLILANRPPKRRRRRRPRTHFWVVYFINKFVGRLHIGCLRHVNEKVDIIGLLFNSTQTRNEVCGQIVNTIDRVPSAYWKFSRFWF